MKTKDIQSIINESLFDEVKKTILRESSAFNDGGEPMMTHNQFRDYSEPSDEEFDDYPYRDDNDNINIERDFINDIKSIGFYVETFNGQEYFIRCKEDEDFMIYFPNDETIEIYDTKNNGQKQEFGYEDAVDYVLKNKDNLLTFDESVRARNREMDIDSQDRINNRAEMGGLNEEVNKGDDVYHITCEGEPIETFENKDEAMSHLDIYKKKHPEKEFIIEKIKYNSPSDMLDKLDEMGEKLEVKENKPMGTNKVKNLAHAIMDAKDKGLKSFKLNGETHDVNESWKQLEEEEFGDGRDEIDMDKDGKITGKDFKMLRNKKEGKCDECSQKMEESEDLTSINEFKTHDGNPVTSEYNGKTITWEDYEVVERGVDGGGYSHEIMLMGSDEDGNEYTTSGSMTSGKIDDWSDNEIEMVNSNKHYHMAKQYNKKANTPWKKSTSSEYDSYSTGEDGEEDMKENKGMCSECGSMMNEDGSCNECGGGMYESKKRTLRLTEREMVDMISRMVSESNNIINKSNDEKLELFYVMDAKDNVKNISKKESDADKFLEKSLKGKGKIKSKTVFKKDYDNEKVTASNIKNYTLNESVPGIDVTKRAQKGSKKENDDYIKEVGTKLKKSSSFDGADNPEFPKQNGKGEKMAINATPEQDEYTATHRGGTLADLDYDQEPSENFKKRLKMALEGDPKMGNSQDAANVIKTDTGKNIGKTSEKKKEIEKKGKEVSWGHSWASPEKVVVVKESKTNMSSVLNEEIERMKKMYGYNEKTQ